MKYSALLAIIAAASAAPASISNTWSTLTPTGTLDESASAITSITGSYALSIRTVSAGVSEGISLDKRDLVNQIGDGQIQQQTADAETKSVVNQIGDGQIQQQTTPAAEPTPAAAETKSVVNQIGDGQIQQQTTPAAEPTPAAAETKSVVNQICDGQIQQQTTPAAEPNPAAAETKSVVNQIGDGQIQQQTAPAAEPNPAAAETKSVVNQIGDGQIQQQTTAPATASVVNQIGDGQIQQQTATPTTAAVANQIGDGQVQQQSVEAESVAPTQSVINQIADGQIQASGSPDSNSGSGSTKHYFEESCVADDSLTISLVDGELRDFKGRVGAIVANRQFQFDGPPPQAGTIYAAGWSFVPGEVAGLGEKESDTKEGGFKLALGDQTTFYKCHSGDFYNLYDESIGDQCSAIEIFLLKAVDC
ncbi:uncharacterized protein CXQ87_004618 [Candidozyma duobushaemuli]|uniref:Cell wall mannoprotein PIR1-like C-terminal domain-containing protein n=1 Tax=Candidozyma duobushaemuli TaxID=1231522 RepID=A0A2V1AGK1_9ASCO|nr:uncharacterized protein CXQ87_004618 [[Candida] duobushaemulonis]PVH17058.1 hypothetical protein CXQ87_004618 [[Candida] duobushaemulonis]